MKIKEIIISAAKSRIDDRFGLLPDWGEAEVSISVEATKSELARFCISVPRYPSREFYDIDIPLNQEAIDLLPDVGILPRQIETIQSTFDQETAPSRGDCD